MKSRAVEFFEQSYRSNRAESLLDKGIIIIISQIRVYPYKLSKLRKTEATLTEKDLV